MAVTEVQIKLPHMNGLGEDSILNRIHVFHTTAQLSIVEQTSVNLAMGNFLALDTAGASSSISSYLSNDLNLLLGGPKTRFRLVGPPPPNPPYGELNLSASAARVDSTDLPEEVAAVMSFKGYPAAGVPGARRRNRIYLGPFNTGVLEHLNNRTVVKAAFRDLVAFAAKRLYDEIGAIGGGANGISWVGVSRAPYGAPVPPSTSPTPGPVVSFPLDQGWIDDAFDTQRRRGAAPMIRKTFDLQL